MSRETLAGSFNLPHRAKARGPSTGRTRHRCLPLGPLCQKCSCGAAMHSPPASPKSRPSSLASRSSEDSSRDSSAMIIFNETYFCVSSSRHSQSVANPLLPSLCITRIDPLCQICLQYARDESLPGDIPRDPLRQGASLARTTALPGYRPHRDRTHISGIPRTI